MDTKTHVVDAPCYPRPFAVNSSHWDAAAAWIGHMYGGQMTVTEATESLAQMFAAVSELTALKPFVKLEEGSHG